MLAKKNLKQKTTGVSKPVANTMLELLCLRYPDAHCELDWHSPFQLLIAVILSAQTTDVW